MSGTIPPLRQYALMVWCSVKSNAQEQFYLYLYPYLSRAAHHTWYNLINNIKILRMVEARRFLTKVKNYESFHHSTFPISLSSSFSGINIPINLNTRMFSGIGWSDFSKGLPQVDPARKEQTATKCSGRTKPFMFRT